MRIAVATEGNKVSMHFGRCQGYTIYEVEGGKMTSEQLESSPPHQPGMLPKWLKDKGADVVIAGGAGAMARQLFGQMGIELILGVTGPVRKAVNEYLEDRLETGPSTCDSSGSCDH